MACVTHNSPPIPNHSLTHRRRAVMCWHNHHANTSFSQVPFLASASSFRPRFSPNSSTRPSTNLKTGRIMMEDHELGVWPARMKMCFVPWHGGVS
jgi:hypothetical protein